MVEENVRKEKPWAFLVTRLTLADMTKVLAAGVVLHHVKS